MANKIDIYLPEDCIEERKREWMQRELADAKAIFNRPAYYGTVAQQKDIFLDKDFSKCQE